MKILKQDIVKKIEKRRKDSLWGHLLTSLYLTQDIYADVRKDKIIVWNWGSWLGSCYSVIIFEFNSKNELIKVSDKLNKFGVALYLFTLVGFSLAFGSIIFEDFTITKLVFIGGAYVIFITLLLLLSRAVYRFGKNETKEYYFKLFDIEENSEKENKPRREWSFKNTTIRFFAYLLCLMLSLVSILIMLDNSANILLGVILLSMVAVYLYFDLKIILEKNRKK